MEGMIPNALYQGSVKTAGLLIALSVYNFSTVFTEKKTMEDLQGKTSTKAVFFLCMM